MQIESIRLKNFRAFKDVAMREIPHFCVLVGANGTGKSTLFSVFGFLRDAMASNLTAALGRLGGSRGLQEVRSRNSSGPIEIELKIRASLWRGKSILITYELHIDEEKGRPFVLREILKNHHAIFRDILDRLKAGIPGVTGVEAKTTEEGRVLLKFQDGAFEDPFLARYVSDGTIKMLAYLVLLYDPDPHPLLCVEEPKKQLYPSLLWHLAEEFRAYSMRGGQVFVSSHSPDFLNAIELDEVFWLVKEEGYTQVKRARDDEQVKAFMAEGDQMGYLWKMGLLPGANP